MLRQASGPRRFAGSSWFAYTTILLLQLKVVWGIWNSQDLTAGDTSYYFVTAYDWYRTRHTLFTWSPLYTSYYGSFLHIVRDAYFATLGHRVVLIFVLAVLVLYLMRRFLPPGIAWLMTAWWVVLPIGFNTMYEVHLFSVVPILCVVLFARWKSPWSRPAALAALVCTTALVRNEYLIASLLFGLIVIGYEVRRLWGGTRSEAGRTLLRYFASALPVFLLIAFFLLRGRDISNLRTMASDKHTLNWCQVYAYGYQQRHQDFTGSAWTGCQELMKATFGVSQPAMVESIRRNPRAALEHFWWNLSLIPNGIELLLFNATAGSVTPDYRPVLISPWIISFLGVSLIAVIVTGAWILYRDRARWTATLKPQMTAWLMIFSMSVVAFVVMITQRPRPSYLLAFGIFLRLITGTALWAITARWNPRIPVRVLVPVVAVLLIVLVPSLPGSAAAGRPLLRAYRRLQPFERLLESRPVHLVAGGWGGELCNYVVKGVNPCDPIPYSDLRTQAPASAAFTQVLAAHAADVLYADESIVDEKPIQQLISSGGWKQIGAGQMPNDRWVLLRLTESATRDIVQPGSGIELGSGWFPYEDQQGYAFRWVENDAEIKIAAEGGARSIVLDLEPGPDVAARELHLDVVSSSGVTLRRFVISHRDKITIASVQPGSHLILRVAGARPHLYRQPALNFRVLHIGAVETAGVAGEAPVNETQEITTPGSGVHIGQGWYPFENFRGEQFRWINNDAELILDAGASPLEFTLEVQPGPGAAGRPIGMRFLDENGSTAASIAVAQRQVVNVKLPVSRTSSSRYRIHLDGGGASTPNDPRILNLRVFRIVKAQ